MTRDEDRIIEAMAEAEWLMWSGASHGWGDVEPVVADKWRDRTRAALRAALAVPGENGLPALVPSSQLEPRYPDFADMPVYRFHPPDEQGADYE